MSINWELFIIIKSKESVNSYYTKRIAKFQRKLKDVGMTIVPLNYTLMTEEKQKMLIALGRGKNF